MSQVVQAVCPGCKQVLRIPAEWLAQPMKCKGCGLVFQARTKPTTPLSIPAAPPQAIPQPVAIPIPQPPSPAAVRATPPKPAAAPPTPLPPSRKVKPSRKAGRPAAVPVAVGAVPPAALAPSPQAVFANLDAPSPEAARPYRRRRGRGTWWKGAVIGLFLLGAVVVGTVFAAPYLSRLVKQSGDLASLDSRPEERTQVVNTTPVKPVGDTAPLKPVATEPARPVEPPQNKPPRDSGRTKPPGDTPRTKPPMDTPKVKPPVEPPVATGKFPRRALLISVNNYLYFNPITYGAQGALGRNFHSLVKQLNNGLRIPLDEVVELSDSTPESAGRPGPAGQPASGPVPPVKPVIEQTVTEFLNTSRAQDHLLIYFAGHAVEMEDQVYLVPIEGEQDNKESMIPLKWLYDQLAGCKARQKVLIMDVCRLDPSRGFTRPGSGSEDSKAPYSMTAKMDEAFNNPPAGVQVWSACIADQYSLEYESNGVFAFSLGDVLAGGIQGTIQHPEDLMPVERLVEPVNQRMQVELTPYGKKQTSRLAGKAPEEGAPYNPQEPPAVVVHPKAPEMPGGVADVAQVKQILGEIDVPPVKSSLGEMGLRAESLPAFPAKTLEAYAAEKQDTDLRKAIKGAVDALNGVKDKKFKEEWYAPADENKFKNELTEYQRKELAGSQRELTEALEDLKKAGAEERAKEPKRWQANYDYVLARLEMQLAYMNEYQGLLGGMKKELPARDKAYDGYRVAAVASPNDSAAKKLATEAKKLLDKVVKDYPNTPWSVLAKRDKLTSLGMELQPAKIAVNR